MTRAIKPGDSFEVRVGTRVDSFRRETDAPTPMFECERIRVTHLACSAEHNHRPYTFGTEPEWFRQRRLEAAKTERTHA